MQSGDDSIRGDDGDDDDGDEEKQWHCHQLPEHHFQQRFGRQRELKNMKGIEIKKSMISFNSSFHIASL